jgi:Flp pilus assembly protein TadD
VPAPARPDAGSPGEARQLIARGYRLIREERQEAAIAPFRRAAQLSTGGDIVHASALFGLGRSLRLAGRPEQAIPVLERRIELPPRTSNSRRELAAARKSSQRTRPSP